MMYTNYPPAYFDSDYLRQTTIPDSAAPATQNSAVLVGAYVSSVTAAANISVVAV